MKDYFEKIASYTIVATLPKDCLITKSTIVANNTYNEHSNQNLNDIFDCGVIY